MFIRDPKNNSPQGLKTMLYCPACHAHYNPLMMKIIEENDEAHLLHIECHNCGTLVLALVLVELPMINSLGLITDLKSIEVKKFIDSKPIEVDDVLDLHQALDIREENIIQKFKI